ncbi:bifunctional riboflavin kinase/FAD synthetase [Poseidonibacter ostreae]|uniref:bifunctional riboflavin kinase/FAD synthetase n=1 Tax=Poseidonibacter ostreae TaxID=2654171 RepID=UPI0012646707|nr:bifunctional riboflavin kinase/FAD synthetase [Poseidonibacter ostreae]KAB7884607.1 bifunctional riboflavin kinase/FAD synthetase [Poseidonibacter ostreae]
MKKNFSTLVNKNTITSLAIGGFDGMHSAHQELFKQLDSNGAILSIESGYATLTPKKYRQEYSKYPIYYYVLDEIKHLAGNKFIELLKKEYPKLKKIVVGFDFCFGKNRGYCIQELKDIFEGNVIVIEEYKIDNIPVHSRTIREYISNGDLKTANKLLNKEYKIYGTQIKGQGLGAKSFVPTINLNVEDFLLPQAGVYISKTILNDIEYNSITFLGHRVTTDGSYAIETHIFDENIINDDYEIQIKFFKKLRDNKKFDSFEELKEQILFDIKEAKEYFINKK